MQNNPPKKKSLFSQHIKTARQNQYQPTDTPFPKPPKITYNIADQSSTSTPTPSPSTTPFITRLLHSTLPKNQIQQLQRDNINNISSMTQPQIKQYQKAIINQIHPALLEKLMKGKNGGEGKWLGVDAEFGNSQQGHQQNQLIRKKMEELNMKQLNEQPIFGTLSQIAFNTTKTKPQIYYQELLSDNETILPTATIRLMLTSYNNQTQILAAKILVQMCLQFFGKNQCNNISLIKISNQQFHSVILALEIYQSMFLPLMDKIQKTRFRSCWIEMMLSLVDSLQYMKHSLIQINNGQLYNQIAVFIQSQTTKRKQFSLIQQGTQGELQKLFVFCESTTKSQKSHQYMQQCSDQQLFELIKKSPTDIIHQLSLQIQYLSKNPTYKFTPLLQHFDTHFPNHLLSFLYPLTLQLLTLDYTTNNMSSDYLHLKTHLYKWFLSKYQNKQFLPPLSTIKQLHSTEEEREIFRKLLLMKILSYQSYTQLLKKQSDNTNNIMENQSDINQISITNNTIACILTYLNIDEYFNTATSITSLQHKAKDIENIQNMLIFISHHLTSNTVTDYLKQIAYIVLVDLMTLFIANSSHAKQQNYIQLTYLDINQQILNSTLSHLCQTLSTQNTEFPFWQLLPQQKIKKLIQAYNYNSFGHYGFTRLIFFLLGSCQSRNTVVVIVEEVLMRYPFLFYYAIEEEYYGSYDMYIGGVVIPEMMNIYEILTFNKKIDSSNMFIRYLLKK